MKESSMTEVIALSPAQGGCPDDDLFSLTCLEPADLKDIFDDHYLEEQILLLNSGQSDLQVELEHDDDPLFSFEEGSESGKTKCKVCSRSFAHIRKHMLTHSKIKPHKCKLCNQSFSQRSNLNRHVASKHGDKYSSCRFCRYKCKRKDKLKIHERNCHGHQV